MSMTDTKSEASIESSTVMYVEKFFYDELATAISELRTKHEQTEAKWKIERAQKLVLEDALTNLKSDHQRVLQMLEIAEAELKDARDFAMDTLARANQAIETDCDKCDYQCQGCIRAIDDAEAVKYNISIALEKIKSLK